MNIKKRTIVTRKKGRMRIVADFQDTIKRLDQESTKLKGQAIKEIKRLAGRLKSSEQLEKLLNKEILDLKTNGFCPRTWRDHNNNEPSMMIDFDYQQNRPIKYSIAIPIRDIVRAKYSEYRTKEDLAEREATRAVREIRNLEEKEIIPLLTRQILEQFNQV